MEIENKKLLIEGARTFGIHLDERTVAAFDLFLWELLKWNQKINLTAIRSETGIITKHFLDSLSVHPHLPKSSSLLDIGSGPGFPGIPLKIVEPTLEVTLIDSVRKKVDFQRHILRKLGLKGIDAIHGRVQESEILQRMGGRFDCVVSRAFSDLSTFLILSYPFLKERGIALAMKGELKGEEAVDSREGERVPYRMKETLTFTLPFTSLKRTILLFEKQ
jgi:16S rRNA (guanine527-N7)-methyltransferase